MNNFKKEMLKNKIKEIFNFFIFILFISLISVLLYIALNFKPRPYTYEDRIQQLRQWR